MAPISAVIPSLLVAAAIPVASIFVPGVVEAADQAPLHLGSAARAFACDLPPVLDPAGDNLPSTTELFGSRDALLKQVARHQAVVQVPSICFDDMGPVEEDERWTIFFKLHEALLQTYPLIHEQASIAKVNTLGLVYTIEGSDPSLKPLLLTAHQDVVPVADESSWTYPPFDAVFDGEFLWGRGASDDKNSLTALLSAVETLLSIPDWVPRRTIILAFGFDEECSGRRGAGTIAEYLTEKYGDNSMAAILDEGGLGQILVDDALYILPSVNEKGYLDVWFSLHLNGGHSSAPPPHTGIGIIAEIATILEAHPYEPKILEGSPFYNHMVCIARYSPDSQPGLGDLLRNGDLDRLASEIAKQGVAYRYLIQTSQAIDYISGGQKINALPEVIRLGVNYRVSPQEGSVEAVQHNIVKNIGTVLSKYNIALEAFQGDVEYEKYVAELGPQSSVEPTGDVNEGYNATLILSTSQKRQMAPTSPTTGPTWDVFSGTVQHSFAFDGIVIPVGQTMNGNTDTNYYLNLTPHVYRWTPGSEIAEEHVHTIDENIRMSTHMDTVKFYYEYIRNMDAADL